MDYIEAINYIHSFSLVKAKKRQLSATKALLKKLGSPEEKLRYVHIVGTNGKGSTAAMIESVMRASGYKTGLFTSPYISRFNERIRIDGEDIPDDVLCKLVSELKPYINEENEPLTEFEFVTILSLLYFYREKCNIVIVEAGLGGEKDYTNVIPSPDCCVITSIGLDHTAILGDTVTKIAQEKSGIIKQGTIVVSLGNSEEADEVFRKKCNEVTARFIKTDLELLVNENSSIDSTVFSFKSYEHIRLPLAGVYQSMNAATAITTLEVLSEKGWDIPKEAVRSGLETVKWRGRFEILSEEPTIILDGAHNPQGCRATVETIYSKFPGNDVVFVTAVMSDKDISGIIDELIKISNKFVCVPLDYPRALPKESYCSLISERGVYAVTADSIELGIKKAYDLIGNKGIICCLGTLYFQNEIRAAVNKCYGKREEHISP